MKYTTIPRILATAALIGLLFPAVLSPVVKDPFRPSAVANDSFMAEKLKTSLSDMGLLALARTRPDILQLTVIPATTSSSPSGASVSISQNALRFINDTSYFPQSETSVAVNPGNTNHVVGGFNDGKFFACGVPPPFSGCTSASLSASVSGFTVSGDGGASVFKGSDIPDIVVNSTFLVSFGDPSVAESVDGNYFYASLAIASNGANGIMIAKSNSDLFNPSISCVTSSSSPTQNACWKAAFVAGNLLPHAKTFEDKELIAVDRSSSSPFFGSVYISWDHFTTTTSSSFLARCNSDLSSCIMLAGGDIPPLSGTDQFADWTTPVVDKNGGVHVTWCNFGTPTTDGPYICRVRSSPPGGTNFGPTVTVLSFMGPGTTLPDATITKGFATEQFRARSIPTLGVDTSATPTSGNLYFAISVCTSGKYNAFPLNFETDNPGNCGLSSIVFSRSADSGSTWSSPVILSTPAVNTQPFATVDTVTGHLFVVYYTTQFDTFNHRIDVVMSKSTDGGSSFTQVRVTSVSNEPDSDPNMFFYLSDFGGSWVAPQYGDYFQATAIGGTLWVLFTANYAVEVGTFQTDPFLAVLTKQ